MFLNQTLNHNPQLIKTCFDLHQKGLLLPDTYVIDFDQLLQNAKMILDKSKELQIELYFMLKQLGRNPLIAKELIKLGYKGAVVVDFKEAKLMMQHHIPICNVGHLVQMPKAMIKELLQYGCKYFTVYSLQKMKEINEQAKKLNIKQKVLLKVIDDKDTIYSGQIAGFRLEQLKKCCTEFKQLKNIEVSGITSFPCFLYDEISKEVKEQNNLATLLKAKQILNEMGFSVENMNAPSVTCVETLSKMSQYTINSAEPGHGLSGTTPIHVDDLSNEIPCVVYISEISHNFDGKSYCYGGGYYRRSHVKHAIVGKNFENSQLVLVNPPELESIDYYFELDQPCHISDTVIMAFRFQIFVTRSNVAIVKGIHQNKATIIGTFNSLGDSIEKK